MKDEEPTGEPVQERPEPPERPVGRGARWGAAVWTLGVTALLVALPLSARDRLPEPLATHWSGSRPDGSMSLTAAALFPAGVWLLLAAGLAAGLRFRPGPARGFTGPVLAGTGVLLTGAQASIVRANLDRARWQDAAPMGFEVILIVVAAGVAGVLVWLATRPAATLPPRPGARMAPPAPGERVVWLSRAANHWMQVAAAVPGLLSAAGVLLATGGRTESVGWVPVVLSGLAAVLLLLCSSVRVRVTDTGLHVGFGPFGRPVRRFAPEELVSARVERLTARQAGGWGYRINGRGTTVFLRRGDCLVVRTRRGTDFAVSVDDAERGAALLNTLIARTADAAASR
ncbi:DUF1648 domain-containing protein [Kitasatospora sp. NPDC089797]|uniref:DUF1648 domain-containing protein n=1 Tax=Kitasatospora sp. NPDC089797 TaxID=3155298 RepID=UPI0034421B3B